MKATKNLKKNIDALMAARGWTSNKPVLAASHALGGSLSNGTLGRIRKDGENVRLNQLDELAKVFDVPVERLLASDESQQGVGLVFDSGMGTGGMLIQATEYVASPGAMATQLATNLADLPTGRRKAIASLVAGLIEAGPSAEEANAIDALAPTATTSIAPDWRHDAFELAAAHPSAGMLIEFLKAVDQFRAGRAAAKREDSPQSATSVR